MCGYVIKYNYSMNTIVGIELSAGVQNDLKCNCLVRHPSPLIVRTISRV